MTKTNQTTATNFEYTTEMYEEDCNIASLYIKTKVKFLFFSMTLEELKNELVSQLWKSRKTFNNTSKYSTYAMHVCHNYVVNLLKRKTTKEEESNLSFDAKVEIKNNESNNLTLENVIGGEDIYGLDMQYLIKTFNKAYLEIENPKQRQRIKFYYKQFLQGKSIRQIARENNISNVIICRYLSIVKNNFRNKLKADSYII